MTKRVSINLEETYLGTNWGLQEIGVWAVMTDYLTEHGKSLEVKYEIMVYHVINNVSPAGGPIQPIAEKPWKLYNIKK